jgi:hypothetical protein
MDVSSGDPWAAYARTVVEIHRPGEADIVVRPSPPGRSGAWPWASSLPVHILTAWDPGEDRPGDPENRVQQAALEADLRHVTRELWSTVGVDAVSGHREEGVAVRGVSDAEARALGARYRQDAIFVWTPDAWVITACNGERRVALGWSVAPSWLALHAPDVLRNGGTWPGRGVASTPPERGRAAELSSGRR